MVLFSSFLHSVSFPGGSAESTLLFRIFSLWPGTLFLHRRGRLKASQPFRLLQQQKQRQRDEQQSSAAACPRWLFAGLLLPVVSCYRRRTKCRSCLQLHSAAVAQAGRQAGQQPEASRQNSTATLRNAGSSDQWIHNSRPSRYGVISQYYPTVIYNICLVPLSTACVSLWGDSIIHIYNSTMKAIISCPVSLFI